MNLSNKLAFKNCIYPYRQPDFC